MNLFRDFEDGTTFSALGFDITLRRRSIGPLVLPSGRLVVCDPITHPEMEALPFKFAPGEYPVTLISAALRDELLIAYAVLELGEATAVKWSVASPGESEESHRERSGFPIDSGVCSFMDLHTANCLLDTVHYEPDGEEELHKQLHAQLRKRRKRDIAWADLILDESSQANLLAFDSGYGDGFYTTYAGVNREGAITRLVVDFQVVDFRFPSFGIGMR